MTDNYRIKKGQELNLKKHDPDDTRLWQADKKSAKEELKHLRDKLVDLQQVLYAENKHKLLIVLQAMDAGGKDGTIRSIFEGVNPQGVKVASFKTPTPQELAHDYLWRIHNKTPQSGEIVIFNRSHYEDVLIVRVKNLAPKKIWEKRYQHIVDFERMLADEGTTIIKFFLNISKDEQKARFLERIEVPEKQWKFNPSDIEERIYWDDYMSAFEDAIAKTSTGFAPWYIVPANRNWYRDLVVAKIIVNTLEGLKMKYPPAVTDIASFKELLENS